ncbi:hypothetical protein [Candidatus Amarolinea dominans]|uniref:hypothetical protein n=1 Tax=Candidatus Amarolinea dominans TaxID=3140696 RepID=UPI0031CCA71E
MKVVVYFGAGETHHLGRHHLTICVVSPLHTRPIIGGTISALAWPAPSMKVILDLDAHLSSSITDWLRRLKKLVFGRNDVIAAVARDQMPISAAALPIRPPALPR